MAQVNMPGRRETALDTVMKGLAIAKDIYGIKADMAQSERADEDRKTAAQNSYDTKNIQAHAGGFKNVPEGTPNAIALRNPGTGETTWMAKGDAIKPPDERLALDVKRFEYQQKKDASDRALKSQQKNDASNLASAPKTYDDRLKDLKGDSRARFDNLSMAVGSIDGMGDALSKGDKTYSLKGDNRFTIAKRNFKEAIGRMQSGGAINKDEAASFLEMAPDTFDSKEIKTEKLRQLDIEMASRLKSLGFNSDEVRSARSALVSNVGNKMSPSGGDGTALGAPSAGGPSLEEIEAAMKSRGLKRGGASGGY